MDKKDIITYIVFILMSTMFYMINCLVEAMQIVYWLKAVIVILTCSTAYMIVVYLSRKIKTIKHPDKVKKIINALSESERLFETIFDRSLIGLGLVGLKGEWIKINPKLIDILGYSEKELTKKDFQSITHSEDLKEDLNNVEKMIKGEIKEYSMQKRYRCKSGKIIWVLLKVSLMRDENGEPLFFISHIQDITKEKLDEEHIKQINEELSQFAYVVSHDLKAPLRAISNLCEWIVEDLSDPDEEMIKKTELLMNRVDRMRMLIDGILEYSRIGRLEIDIGDINIQEVIDRCILLDDYDNFDLIFNKKLPTIRGNFTQLTQIFANMFSNAKKHHDKNKGVITVDYEEQKDKYIFYVCDDGPGIPKDHRESIFEIFKTLKPRDQEENVGIGLCIIKKIIIQNGGAVWVEDNKPRGCKFVFIWPKNNEILQHSHSR